MSLDTGAVLGEEFGNLKKLHTLHITGAAPYKGVKTIRVNLTDHSLKRVPHIEKLTVSYVLDTLAPNALKPLKRLKELRLILNLKFPSEQAFVAVKNMKGATLTHLILDGSHDEAYFSELTELMVFDISRFSISHVK